MPAHSGKPLNAEQAQRFTQAMGLLQSGRSAHALAIAEVLVQQAPQATDAWQLLGMCLAEAGRQPQANTAFERALALMPGNAMVSRNYGISLARHGKALRTQSRFDEAVPVLRKALEVAPAMAFAWVDLGVVLRLLGHVDDALLAFQRAATVLDPRSPAGLDVQNAINGVLADAGRPAEALANARKLVALSPNHAPAYEALGNLLWEHGEEIAPGEDPLGELTGAVRAQPGNQALQLSLARMLMAAKRPQEALELLHPMRQREPGNPLLDWFAADALDALRQHEQAAPLYEAAARTELGKLPDFLNAQARHAFRTGKFDLALNCAAAVIELDPFNQEGWAYQGIAWRLSGDEREQWLCDYETLVGHVDIAAPPGFDDVPAFLALLADTLKAMHKAKREPVHQSVRGGTQTAGQLFGRDHSVIRAAEVALRKAVQGWLATLPDDLAHPFLLRKQESVNFVGSWSVNLNSSGRHSNHIHSRGWLSSAFYVSLPAAVLDSDGDSRAGWIQFGQPLEDLGLDLSPRRFIQPRPGTLALFPSYMWHGTVPFVARESRLTIAFDAQPCM